jgi:hypothetical protein
MVEVGHSQAQVPLFTDLRQHLQQAHGVGPAGNRCQDPGAGLKKLFIRDKAANRRQERAGPGRCKKRRD